MRYGRFLPNEKHSTLGGVPMDWGFCGRTRERAEMRAILRSHGNDDPGRLLFLRNLFERVPKLYRDCFEQGVLGKEREAVLAGMFFRSCSSTSHAILAVPTAASRPTFGRSAPVTPSRLAALHSPVSAKNFRPEAGLVAQANQRKTDVAPPPHPRSSTLCPAARCIRRDICAARYSPPGLILPS
jgi:hypothetical protein